jgi:hypothetical protein
MLVRDMLTGYLHEVPEAQLYGLPELGGVNQVLYDGLGNPLGFFFLPKLVSGAAKLVGGLIGGRRPAPVVGSRFPLPSYRPYAPCPPCPPCPTLPVSPPGPYPMAPYPMPYGRRRRRRRDARP